MFRNITISLLLLSHSLIAYDWTRIDGVVAEMQEELGIPGVAVGILEEGEWVSKGYGYRDVEKQLPMTPDTLQPIGSCTKAFTAMVLAQLVEDGKILFDDPVADHMPEFRMADPYLSLNVTVRDLLCHRTGLPRHDLVWIDRPNATRQELVAAIKDLPLSAGLREKFQYCNLTYVAAGCVAERVTGQSWEELLKDRIFRPLGMDRTTTEVEEWTADDNFAWSYLVQEDVVEPLQPLSRPQIGPAGTIASSVNELEGWLRVQLREGQEIANGESVAGMQTPQILMRRDDKELAGRLESYGLGWMVQSYRGHHLVHHGGMITHYQAWVSLLPDENKGIVMLINAPLGMAAKDVEHRLVDALLELEPQVEIKAGSMNLDTLEQVVVQKEQRTVPLEAIVGEYADRAYGKIGFFVESGELIAEMEGQTVTCHHKGRDSYEYAHPILPNLKIQLTFRTDDSGKVDSVAIPYDAAVDPIRFARLAQPVDVRSLVGKYELSGIKLEVKKVGGELMLISPGQGPVTLQHQRDLDFVVKEAPVVTIRFIKEDGTITALDSIQPQGTFRLSRGDADGV